MVQSVKVVACPSCGSNISLRAAGHTVRAVCESCRAHIDPNDETYFFLGEYDEATRLGAGQYLPFGARGTLENKSWETIGFRVLYDGEFQWHEYLLFNPYYGFRFLVESDGHWTLYHKTNLKPDAFFKFKDKNSTGEKKKGTVATITQKLDEFLVKLKFKKSAYGEDAYLSKLFKSCFRRFDDKKYKLFNVGETTTLFVAGEFYWQAEAYECVMVLDAIAPPNILSLELNDDEISVSTGKYIPAEEVRAAFQLPAPAPKQKGVAPAQPTVVRSVLPTLLSVHAAAAGVLVLGYLFFDSRAQNQQVLEQTFIFPTDSSVTLLSPTFQLTGAPANLALTLQVPTLANSWLAFDVTLINVKTGESRVFTQEAAYYFGVANDGEWEDGDKENTQRLSTIPDGEYYLAFDPYLPKETVKKGKLQAFIYKVVRDEANPDNFLLTLFGLAACGLIYYVPYRWTEYRRWKASSEDNPYAIW